MTLHHATRFVSLAALVLALCNARPAAALANDPEDAKAAPTEESSAPAAAQGASDDAALKPAEPEFRVINVPTTLVIPRNRLSFDLTHRFAGNLANESFADSARNLFGLDQGALIGFEFRYGIVRHVQAAVYRATIDKTFQFHGKYD